MKYPQVFILSDDIYEKIVYDGNTFHTIAEVCPFLYDRTLPMNGLSKSYCMTGWRVGYAAGPVSLINAMNKVQSQNVSSTASISMAASVEALNGDQSFIISNNESFLRRRNLVVKNLNETPGLSCRTPEGAFYVFPSCSNLLGKKERISEVDLLKKISKNFYLLSSLVYSSCLFANTAQVAIVIDDMGYRYTDKHALALPGNVTYAILPHTTYGK